jgi:hypothetical protein
MIEQQKEIILTKNNQPIKEISYQDMYQLKETFDQISSWKEALTVVNNFFNNREIIPFNKKKIMKEFHANSYIFNTFYQDFLASTTILEKQIEELKSRPKAKVEKSSAISPELEEREMHFL